MTPLSIITNLLQSVPPIVRKTVLALWVLAFLLVEILDKVGVATGAAGEVLLYLAGYLGIQSAANVDTTPKLDEHDTEAWLSDTGE